MYLSIKFNNFIIDLISTINIISIKIVKDLVTWYT